MIRQSLMSKLRQGQDASYRCHASRWHPHILVLIMVILLSGCAGTMGGSSQGMSLAPTKILAVGSTALQPLVTAAAALFEKQYPQVRMTVQGGGSVTGLKAVNNHNSGIGDSDIYADPATYSDPNLTDHIVCVIPFVVVVGPGVTISKLTSQQIIDIFSTGTIRNWQQVGGPDLKIVPIIRPITSGTRATFRKYVLGNLDTIGTLLTSDSSQTVLQTVENTSGAIGYTAQSVLDAHASVKTIAIDGATATPSNIEAQQYSFWGFEHMYTLNTGDPAMNAFLNFMTSPQIQQLAKQMGYIPISDMKLLSPGGHAQIENNGSQSALATRDSFPRDILKALPTLIAVRKDEEQALHFS